MLYDPRPYRNGIRVGLDEHHVILKERLATLEDACQQGTTLTSMPVAWRGAYTAHWYPLSRDRRGELQVRIIVKDKTRPKWYYERYIRLVPRRHLPTDLAFGLARGDE